MATKPKRSGIIQGTLDLLVLRTLVFSPMHGHGIATHIRTVSDDALNVEHGSLYPALQRLEKVGCITSAWEITDAGRELKRYRITPRGRAQLRAEESKWAELTNAMSRLLRPAKGRS